MKMPLEWGKEFAPVTCEIQEYADKMTMTGTKVEGFEREADKIKNVVLGQIVSIVPHPDSDHMVICQVNVGEETPVQIVTGANNLKTEDFVPVALHKSRLPDGTEIRKGKLRGVESCGMLCSIAELGFTKNDFPNAVEEGILVFDQQEFEPFVVGTPIVQLLGMEDTVVEFEITPNRPDCLSVRGIAREMAATFGIPFQDHIPTLQPTQGDVNEHLKVSVENTEKCFRYMAAVVKDVRVGPSPRWMRERLRRAGVRPINNLVDITNYVMLEQGQPMHCFDYRYVNGGTITVRNAKQDETVTTLDGVQRTLTQEMLVIADEKGAIAVAGVMGAEHSGVQEDTTMVVLESAMFDGPSVRTTAKQLGLRTESSGRYEKGLDPNGCCRCLERALELVQMLGVGQVVNGMIDICSVQREERSIPLKEDAINRLLGTNLSKEAMIALLKPVGLEVENNQVRIPSWRADITRDCDLAEEVARFVGYNQIPATLLKGVACARPTQWQTFTNQMLDALTGYGFYEIESFSFYGKKVFDAIHLPQEDALRNGVVIANPLGEDTSIMRTTALPGLLENLTRNAHARASECAVFEAATCYFPNENTQELPQEKDVVVLGAYGSSWGYLALKGVLEQWFSLAGLSQIQFIRNEQGTSYHPGRCADIYIGERKIGVIGEIHPIVLENYEMKSRIVAAEIEMKALFEHRADTPVFHALPKHPSIVRDLAFVCDDETPAAQVAQAIEKASGKLLEDLILFDVYTGEHIQKGKKSLAYKLILRAQERTLTDEEAEKVVQKVLKHLAEMNVVLRQ